MSKTRILAGRLWLFLAASAVGCLLGISTVVLAHCVTHNEEIAVLELEAVLVDGEPVDEEQMERFRTEAQRVELRAYGSSSVRTLFIPDGRIHVVGEVYRAEER